MLKYTANNSSIIELRINRQISEKYQTRIGILKENNRAHILLQRISNDSMVIKSNDIINASELIACDGNKLIIRTMCLDNQDRKIVINRLIKKVQRFFNEKSRKKVS